MSGLANTVWIQQQLGDTQSCPEGRCGRSWSPLWGTLHHSGGPIPLRASFQHPEAPSTGLRTPAPLRRGRSGPGQSLPLLALGGPREAPRRVRGGGGGGAGSGRFPAVLKPGALARIGAAACECPRGRPEGARGAGNAGGEECARAAPRRTSLVFWLARRGGAAGAVPV